MKIVGEPILSHQRMTSQGSRGAHLPRRECSYGSFRGNPGFGCIKVSHHVSCFHYMSTCPKYSHHHCGVRICLHIFACVCMCLSPIILMILFAYCCCYLDTCKYVCMQISFWREVYIVQFVHWCVSVTWLPSTQLAASHALRPSPMTAAAPSPNTTLNCSTGSADRWSLGSHMVPPSC